MSGGNDSNFFYLNRDGRWPGLESAGIERGEDGALQLSSLPRREGELTETLADLDAPDAPAGVAVAPDGTVFWTEPDGSRLFARDPCNGAIGPAPCIGDEGSDPTRFHTPRGLLVHPIRNALIVADSGNHRIQLFALDSLHLVGVWGGPGDVPGRFNEPWSLAVDEGGNVYVVDYGNRRVQKFDLHGRVIPGFWENVVRTGSMARPSEVAVAAETGEVYALDSREGEILVFDTDGTFNRRLPLRDVEYPTGLLVHRGSIYLGNNGRRRLLRLGVDGALAGEAYGYEGPVAALATDGRDRLWLAPGAGQPPLPLAVRGAFVKNGVLWGGPFSGAERPVAWHRLKACGAPLASGAHFRFYVYTSDDRSPPARPKLGPEPFKTKDWEDRPEDVADVLVGGEPRRYLWVGVHLSSEGLRSSRIDQIRVDYDHETYGKYLPAIYYTKSPDKGLSPQPELLDRFLSLFESFFTDIEGQIEHLARYFDPATVPSAWIPWLAGWLALDLDEELPEEKKRQAIAMAFATSASRGTADGLRRALHFYAGVDAWIDEPLLQTGWWALPPTDVKEGPSAEQSILGFTTFLVSSEAQGAVVGTSAVLDRSHLIRQEQFGVPLFEETAHQFSVSLYRSEVCDSGKLEEVRAIIEREKPAHTLYELCLIEPGLRVGYQARVGIDTVVGGGPPAPSRLGERRTGRGTVLAGEPTGRIGERSRLGQTTRLGTGAIEATE